MVAVLNVRLGKINTALRILEELNTQLNSVLGNAIIIKKVQSTLNELDMNRNASDAKSSQLCRSAELGLQREYSQYLFFVRTYLGSLVTKSNNKLLNERAISSERTALINDMKEDINQAHSYLFRLRALEERQPASMAA